MQLDSFSFDQHRLECLNAEAMERGRAIQQDGVIADDFFENIPDDGVLLLHQFFGLFDRGAVAALLEPVVDEGFEQLERHLLGQATLMEPKLRPDHNDRAAGVIDALSEQILTEAAKRPPSRGTSGRSSGGITGMTSRIIHSGLLPDLRKLSTTRRRLAYFSFFCAEVSVFIFSRIS